MAEEYTRTSREINNILAQVAEQWDRAPALRLGQMIASMLTHENQLYFMSDEQFIRHLKEFMDEHGYNQT